MLTGLLKRLVSRQRGLIRSEVEDNNIYYLNMVEFKANIAYGAVEKILIE